MPHALCDLYFDIAQMEGCQVAIQLPVVHTVTHHKYVRNVKASEVDGKGDNATNGAIEQGADIDAFRVSSFQMPDQVTDGEASVDNVLNNKYVLTGDRLIQVFQNLNGFW